MRKRRALIIGGSLGGLFAAHQLQSIGWDVDVFERTSDDLRADSLEVLMLPGWCRSVGVTAEINFGRGLGLPIAFKEFVVKRTNLVET